MSYSWPSDFAVTYFVHTNEFLVLEKSFFILRVPLWSFLCWITYISRGNLLIEIHIVSTFEWFLNFRGSSTERKVSEWPEQLGPFPFFSEYSSALTLTNPTSFSELLNKMLLWTPHMENTSPSLKRTTFTGTVIKPDTRASSREVLELKVSPFILNQREMKT